MVAIEVHFLTGRYSATSHHDREQPEWPPHGARLFSALVATWADAEPPDEHERSALEWLESLPAPRITAGEIVPRRVASHFVPVNDASVISQSPYKNRAGQLEELSEQLADEMSGTYGELTKKAQRILNNIRKKRDVASLTDKIGTTNPKSALALLPEGRVKKERCFPSVTLLAPKVDSSSRSGSGSLDLNRVPSVVYAWDDTPSPEITEVLDGLLTRVSRLGHSSSLVSCRLRDEAPPATHTPGEGTLMLRWVRSGQLEALEYEYQRHQAIKPRSLPFHGIRYRQVESDVTDSGDLLRPSSAGEWVVFEVEPRHRRKPMTRTVELTKTLRQSLFSYVPNPLPEGISGHLDDGRPTTLPHIGFLALPNVGYEYSDGRIMGFAISLPDELDEEALRATFRGIGAWERKNDDRSLQLKMGHGGCIKMSRRQPPFALVSLRRPVWSRPSRWWASATPVALPVHPGDLSRGNTTARAKAWARAEDAVARSCEHVGLPRPVDVRVSFAPYLVGARPAHDFPAFKQGRRKIARRLVHAAVEFSEKVQGPLVLGSGRFMGLGLMRTYG